MNTRIIAMLLVGLSLLGAVFFYSACETLPYNLEISDMLPVAFSFLATVFFASAYFLYGRWTSQIKNAWGLLTLGCALWFLGEASYAFIEITTKQLPFPSLADLFWLIGYLPLIAGLYLLFRAFSSGKEKLSLVVAIISITGTALTIVSILIPSALKEPDRIAAFLNLAYPIGDFVILGFALALIAMLCMKKNTIEWVTLALGFALITLADILFSQFTFLGEYGFCHPVNVVWIAGYAMLALAAYLRISTK